MSEGNGLPRFARNDRGDEGDGLPRRCAPRNDRGTDCHGLRPRNDRKERDCRGCGTLCYEHEAGRHTAHCTDSSRTPRGEKRRTLLVSRLDIEALEAPIVRPKWCDKEEIGNG